MVLICTLIFFLFTQGEASAQARLALNPAEDDVIVPRDIPTVTPEDRPVEYRLMEKGSNKGKNKLFDSLGFSYIYKRTYSGK